MYWMMYDSWSWVLYLLGIVMVFVAIGAQVRVKSTFAKYSKLRNARGLTGAQAAEQVLAQNGVSGVRVVPVAGDLTDHYDPKDNTIHLSEQVFGSDSVAAVGVAAHEAGHAVQYAKNYAPIKIRMAIVPVAQIGSAAALPIALIGFLLSAFAGMGQFGMFLLYAGIILYAAVTLFQLVTLPVELNASHRALKAMGDGGLLMKEEYAGAKSVLTAAAMTYVAALAASLIQLLRLIAMANSRRR